MRAEGAFVVVPHLQEAGAAYATSGYHDYHAFGVLQLFAEGWLAPVCQKLISSLAVGSARSQRQVSSW